MTNVLQELLNICRFCLCENKQHLKPIMEMLDSTLTADEVARYTGVQVNIDEGCTIYAMCVECTGKLRESIEFRQTCLNNRNHFEELLMMLVASAECTSYEFADGEKYMDCSDDTMEQELADQLQEKDSNIELQIHSPNNSQPSDVCVEDDEMYCANYIEPATSYHSDSDDVWEIPTKQPYKKPRKKYTFKKNAPPEPIVKKERKGKKKAFEFSALAESELYYVRKRKDEKRFYMKQLCDICGNLVNSLPSHMETHLSMAMHSCPHCPVLMKSKKNITQHINTVHNKIIYKSCDICGKSFIHHKTYRYHMLAHQSEGKAFKCIPCDKTFDKPFGLRDHNNRVHNVAKTLKRAD